MDGAVNLKQQKKPVLPRMKKYAGFYVLFLPVLAFLVVFHYLPMFGIYYSFTKYTIIKDPVWVGLANFERLFAMPNFWNAFQNTLELSVVKLLLTTTFSVVLSLLLNEMQNIHGKKLAQTIIYLPHFMSWVVTASVFQLILSPATAGLVNQVLISLGIVDEGIYFLGSSQWWKSAYYVINIWHDTGWGTIIFMATLTSIDPGIYEAASIDGAGRWKKMWYVTLPALANTHHHRADPEPGQDHESVRERICIAERRGHGRIPGAADLRLLSDL